MSSLQSKRVVTRGLAAAASAGLLTGLLVTGQAAAQTTGAVKATASNTTQDAGTKREPVAHDPFSPFVYDVLGATPSIRLPVFLGKQARAGAMDSNEVSSTDGTGKDAVAKPTVAAAAGHTETGARLPQ